MSTPTKANLLSSLRALRGMSISRFSLRQGSKNGEENPQDWKEGASRVDSAILLASGFRAVRLSNAEMAILDKNDKVIASVASFYSSSSVASYVGVLWKENGKETTESKAANLESTAATAQDIAARADADRLLLLGTVAFKAADPNPEPVAKFFLARAVGALKEEEIKTLATLDKDIAKAEDAAA